MKESICLKWRRRAGLASEEVDKKLEWRPGMTAKYESMDIVRIPCSDLYSLVRVYRVPVFEAWKTFEAVRGRLRVH